MEEDPNGRQTQVKTTSIIDYLNGRLPQWKTSSMEEDALVLIKSKLKAKQQLMVVALLRATL